jgi:DNA-binding NtrC family response regulator
VLDVVMPHISGPEAFRQMRAIDPDVKVLMISGFGADAEALLHEGVRGFVGKPFNAAELSRALASAIAPKPA